MMPEVIDFTARSARDGPAFITGAVLNRTDRIPGDVPVLKRRRENSMSKWTKFVACLVAALGLFHAASVQAVIHSGTICQPWAGSQGSDIWADYNRILNNSSDTRIVSCPLVRTNTTNTNGTSMVYVRVERSSLATQSLSCSLYSFDLLGGYVESDFATYSGIGRTSLYLDVDSSASVGYYGIYCYLPEYSSIFSIRVEEF